MRYITTLLLVIAVGMTVAAELLQLTAALTSGLATVSLAVAVVFVLTLVLDKDDQT